MLTAIRSVHWKKGPWASNGGYEYNAALIAALLGLAKARPGRWSLDHARARSARAFRGWLSHSLLVLPAHWPQRGCPARKWRRDAARGFLAAEGTVAGLGLRYPPLPQGNTKCVPIPFAGLPLATTAHPTGRVMERRTLGAQGLEVLAEGLGCMGMSEFYGPTDEAEAIATIQRALDLGVDFLDTADAYGPFANERLVGRAIAGRRDEVVLATKFGNERREDGSWVGINGRPEYVRAACEA